MMKLITLLKTNKKSAIGLSVCAVLLAASIFGASLGIKLHKQLQESPLASLQAQQQELIAKEDEIDRKIAEAEPKLIKSTEELQGLTRTKAALDAELAPHREMIDRAKKNIETVDGLYDYFFDICAFSNTTFEPNYDADGAMEMEQRGGIGKRILDALDNPITNAVLAGHRQDQGQISRALVDYNSFVASKFDEYSQGLRYFSEIGNMITEANNLASPAQKDFTVIYENTDKLEAMFNGDMSPEFFQPQLASAAEDCIRLRVLFGTAAQAYRMALADTPGNRMFINELEANYDNLCNIVNKYYTGKMGIGGNIDADVIDMAPIGGYYEMKAEQEALVEMLSANKRLMEAVCINGGPAAQSGPGIQLSQTTCFKGGVGNIMIDVYYKEIGSDRYPLVALETDRLTTGGGVRAAYYYDMNGYLYCMDSVNTGASILWGGLYTAYSTVANPDVYQNAGDLLRNCFIDKMSEAEFKNIYFEKIFFNKIHGNTVNQPELMQKLVVKKGSVWEKEMYQEENAEKERLEREKEALGSKFQFLLMKEMLLNYGDSLPYFSSYPRTAQEKELVDVKLFKLNGSGAYGLLISAIYYNFPRTYIYIYTDDASEQPSAPEFNGSVFATAYDEEGNFIFGAYDSNSMMEVWTYSRFDDSGRHSDTFLIEKENPKKYKLNDNYLSGEEEFESIREKYKKLSYTTILSREKSGSNTIKVDTKKAVSDTLKQLDDLMAK